MIEWLHDGEEIYLSEEDTDEAHFKAEIKQAIQEVYRDKHNMRIEEGRVQDE